MKQLNVFCEGQTEQGFCTQVLQPHLFPLGDGIIHTLAVGAKDHHHVYGIGRWMKYERVRKFIRNTIKQLARENVVFTTMFDLYALPADFPGKNVHSKNEVDPTRYVVALEKSLAADIDCFQFIPYLQLHEYETLLFADPEAFAVTFENCGPQIEQLKAIAASKANNIELIDDGPHTAPSKRIVSVIREYEGRKATAGPDIAAYIGISAIRAKCPHFDSWLTRIENLSWNE